MRACEGCRRRKIKCDAATTNSWPCAACVRLKLNCIPPTVAYDKDYSSATQTFELERPPDFTSVLVASSEDFQRQQQMLQHQLAVEIPQTLASTNPASYPLYQTSPYVEPDESPMTFSAVQPPTILSQDFSKYTAAANLYSAPASHLLPTSEPEPLWRNETASADLSDALGQLKISQLGVGM